MKLNSRLTSGLAWAGLLLVVGVPSANVLWPQGQSNKDVLLNAMTAEDKGAGPIAADKAPAALSVADGAASAPAAVPPTPQNRATPVAGTEAVASADPVDRYLASGKPLPSYISNGGAGPAPVTGAANSPSQTTVEATATGITITPAGPAAPVPAQSAAAPIAPQVANAAGAQAPVVPPGPQDTPTQVAALPDPVPPIPAPVSLRPKTPVVDQTQTASIHADSYPDYITVPPADVRPQPDSADAPIVSAQDLAAWKRGGLGEYLAANGLLTEPPRSKVRVWAYRRYVPQADVGSVPSDGQYYVVPDGSDPGTY